MARLIYSAIASLDGYVSDATGNFSWAAPDEEVHAFVNELERPIGTYLYGRRMYETMAGWETIEDGPEVVREFAEIWRGAQKVVFSRTLDAVATSRTRLERSFEAAEIRRLKDSSASDISIGGPTLAAHALRADLVDECRLLLAPINVGSGTPAMPGGIPPRLELVEQSRFAGGMVHLRYMARD